MNEPKQGVLLVLFLVALIVVFVAVNRSGSHAPSSEGPKCLKVPHRVVDTIAQIVVPHRRVFGIAAIESRDNTGYTIPAFNRGRLYLVRVTIYPRPGPAVFAASHSMFATGSGIVIPVDRAAQHASTSLADPSYVGVGEYTDGYDALKRCH